MDKVIAPLKQFDCEMTAPPDKSITHRAILFSAFSDSNVKIRNALLGEDCLSSISCVQKLGARVRTDGTVITVNGTSRPDSAVLDVGNSGTTIRLLCGLLAGQKGKTFVLDGDASVRRRPMNRVTAPLGLMHAIIGSANGTAPLQIEGAALRGIAYQSPVASAQVKSAVLLAGLNAEGETSVTEPVLSRDHTERMLKYFGADIRTDGVAAYVRPSVLKPCDIEIPGDISSAAYPLVLAAGLKNGHIIVRNVGVNPTRDGILKILTRCGANFRLFHLRGETEPVADIELTYAPLRPFRIGKEEIPSLIDEIPALCVLAAFINGESVIAGAEELKVKESNRIDTVVNGLKSMGADIEARPDGMAIRGNGRLTGGADIDPCGDHRIAMSMAVAAALSQNGARIRDAGCAAISYPGFYSLFGE